MDRFQTVININTNFICEIHNWKSQNILEEIHILAKKNWHGWKVAKSKLGVTACAENTIETWFDNCRISH